MEQSIAFTLGIIVTILVREIFLVFKEPHPGWEILDSRMFNLQKQVLELEKELKLKTRLLDRRIDGEIDRINKLFDQSIEYTSSQVGELESKITGNNGAKQILKG